MAEVIYESPIALATGVFRVLANNPSPMTGKGTNTYLVGTSDFIAIDPGPADEEHIDAIIAASGGHLRYIVVTHAHRDHYPGAMMLRAATDSTLLAFSPRDDFAPDGTLTDGDVVKVPGATLRAIHTPGHSSDHLCYLLEESDPRLLFTGDHILGGTTTAISPPDGDMSAYLHSLDRLLAMADQFDAIAPGHGGLITNPAVVIGQYRQRRLDREAAIVELLTTTPVASVAAITDVIYRGLSERLQRAAQVTMWAHLQKLTADGVVTAENPNDIETSWALVAKAG